MSGHDDRPVTMIPGPIEFDDDVLNAMSTKSMAHTSPTFVTIFETALKQLRTLFFAQDPAAQAFAIAGGGTLGWDLSANFVQPGEKVLLVNTGFFSHSWAECFRAYGIEVTELVAPIGARVPTSDIEKALKSDQFKAVAFTHVDTSTSVINDVEALSKLIKDISPEALVFVDGVCSIGCEPFYFDAWGIDFVLSASQKAIGAPAGLSISVASQRALEAVKSRSIRFNGFYADILRWLPIMRAYESGNPAYFSTPPVQNVIALKTTLLQIAPDADAVKERWAEHEKQSDRVKDSLEKKGIKLVPESRDIAAHGLTAAYVPDTLTLKNVLPQFLDKGFVVAGGILPPIAQKTFRIGHMGVSVTKRDDLDRLVGTIGTLKL